MGKNQFKKLIFIAVSIIYVFFTCPEKSSALPQNRVKNTIFTRHNNVETAIIITEEFTRTTHFVLKDPERVVVDIHQAFIPRVKYSKQIDGHVAAGIRINQNKKDIVRVVIDINEQIPYSFDIKKEYINNIPGIKILLYSKVASENKDDPYVPESSIETRGNVDTRENSENTSMALLGDTVFNDIFEESEFQEGPPDFSLSGDIRVRGTSQIKEDESIENNQTFRNKIFIEGKYKKQLTVSGLSDYLYFSHENQTDDYDIDLYEAKWEYTGKDYGFSLGKQIVRWGKTDQISPVDTLNPQDMREYIIPDYEERKIPVWMGRFNIFFDGFALEGIYIPFFEESNYDYFQTNWALFGHLKKEIQNSAAPSSVKDYFNDMTVNETSPSNESEWAVRLTSTIKEVDFGLTFHRTIEDNPYFKSFPVKNINITGNISADDLTGAVFTNENIEVEYKRSNIAGFEFETVFGEFGLRGEAAWQDKESFITSSFTSVRKPTFIYILGADHTTEENIYFNIQFLHKYISDYDSDILYFSKNTYSLLGEISTDIVSDWLEAAVEYSVTLNDDSWYISPYLTYTYVTNLKTVLGTYIFSGDETTWLGRYKNNDVIFMDITYHF